MNDTNRPAMHTYVQNAHFLPVEQADSHVCRLSVFDCHCLCVVCPFCICIAHRLTGRSNRERKSQINSRNYSKKSPLNQ